MRNPRLRNTLVFAGVILFVEIMWTPPVFSALILLVSLGLAPFNFTILYFKKERDVIFFSVKQLIVFLLLVIISSAVFLFDLNKAESKASEIVSACEEYKNEKGLYPESIGELKTIFLKRMIMWALDILKQRMIRLQF